MQTIDEALKKLADSPFRSSFHLSEEDIRYCHEKGRDLITQHTYDFITTRLAPAVIPNDGHQTPFRGHPVFLAQHATATCCRKCLFKWYRIPPERQLTERQTEKIVNLIMAWIDRQIGEHYE